VKTVLVVDDEADIVEVILAVLAEHDVTVLAAYDGRAALELARRARPDLVLSDVMMPGLDGRELCALIKADPDLAGTRVALMSAMYKLDLRDIDEDARPQHEAAKCPLVLPERPLVACPAGDVAERRLVQPLGRQPFVVADVERSRRHAPSACQVGVSRARSGTSSSVGSQ
jgi:CheY-like chemotaxis protein